MQTSSNSSSNAAARSRTAPQAAVSAGAGQPTAGTDSDGLNDAPRSRALTRAGDRLGDILDKRLA